MGKKFNSNIPKKPILRRQTYEIPSTYLEGYKKSGVTDPDEQIMLFHTTQFGGFRIESVPKDMRFDEKFLKRWFKQKFEFGYYHFKANDCFLGEFGNLELRPLQKRWRSKPVNDHEMRACGFSKGDIVEAYKFLKALNGFYSSLRLDIERPQSGITAEDTIQLSRFHGTPYLVKKPKAGGRFFHPEVS